MAVVVIIILDAWIVFTLGGFIRGALCHSKSMPFFVRIRKRGHELCQQGRTTAHDIAFRMGYLCKRVITFDMEVQKQSSRRRVMMIQESGRKRSRSPTYYFNCGVEEDEDDHHDHYDDSSGNPVSSSSNQHSSSSSSSSNNREVLLNQMRRRGISSSSSSSNNNNNNNNYDDASYYYSYSRNDRSGNSSSRSSRSFISYNSRDVEQLGDALAKRDKEYSSLFELNSRLLASYKELERKMAEAEKELTFLRSEPYSLASTTPSSCLLGSSSSSGGVVVYTAPVGTQGRDALYWHRLCRTMEMQYLQAKGEADEKTLRLISLSNRIKELEEGRKQ